MAIEIRPPLRLALPLLVLVQVAAAAQDGPSAAPDEAVAAENAPVPQLVLTIDLASRHLWRGYDLSHGDPTLQASLTYSARSGLWASVGIIAGLSTAPGLGDTSLDLDEVDAALGWEWGGLDGGKLTAGVALYAYRYTSTWTKDVAYGDDSDVEANLYLSWNPAAHLQPTLDFYYGLDDSIRGYYLEAGIALPFTGDSWSFEPKLTAAWSNQYEVDDRMTNATVTLPLSLTLGPATITPSLQWVRVGDPERFNPPELVGETPRTALFVGTVRLAFTL